jgi:hypothetical protein
MKYGLTFILLLFIVSAFGQDIKSNKLVQFSGIITDTDSNTVVPYVTITNLKNKDTKYAANYQGYFSIIVNPGDTILFTAVGFANKTIVLPTTIAEHKYTEMIKMKAEVIYLKPVTIYPWATVEEFNRDFLAMKVADDDVAIAKRNLSPKSIKGMSVTLPRNGQEITNSNYRYNFDRMSNVNMRQTNPLLNPFAWGKLMQQIFNGDKIRSEDK